jgi:predicted HD phosphohydrolase
MSELIKYECFTASVALDLVNHISDLDGSVCVIMRGNEPTSKVLTNHPLEKSECVFTHLACQRYVTKFDEHYFKEQMR